MPVALDSIRDLADRADRLLAALQKNSFSPSQEKHLDRRWSVTEAAELVGRTPQALRDAEARGDIPPADRRPGSSRRLGYTLEQINEMRRVFGSNANRTRGEDSCCILAIQNFKGGVSKSTTAVHLAQHLASTGMRTLLVDADSQGSSTFLMGLRPDFDLDVDETLFPFLVGERSTLNYAIRGTYYPNLKLIPANLGLYQSEYAIAAQMARSQAGGMMWTRLRAGLESIADDFDVVIIDPPPQMGMISLNVLYAATGVLIPMPPSILDFSSTAQFFRMVTEVFEQIADVDPVSGKLHYDFVKVMISRKREKGDDDQARDTAENAIADMAKDFFGKFMLQSVLYESNEVQAATMQGKTLFDLEKPIKSASTHKRAKACFEFMGNEVSTLIRRTWPSHVRRARKTGDIELEV